MIDQSALHIASLWGSLDVVKLLIGAGANPNAKNRFGAAPLHCAAQRSQAAVGEFLVQHGADPALVAGNGLAPYEMVADEALRPAFGAPRTELHLAAAAPDPVPALEAVLRAPGIDVNGVDERGDTALAIVARRCHAAACALLLERGATTGAYNRDGMSALHIASSLPLLPGAGSPPETGGAPAPEHIVAVVRLLLEGRADPNAPTRARGEYTSGAWERREADGSTSRVTDVGVSCLQLAVEVRERQPPPLPIPPPRVPPPSRPACERPARLPCPLAPACPRPRPAPPLTAPLWLLGCPGEWRHSGGCDFAARRGRAH